MFDHVTIRASDRTASERFYDLVLDSVRGAAAGIAAVDVAERAGVSRGTARRYLEYLEKTGAVELTLRYGTTGRPEHLYSWAGAVSPS